MSKRQTRAQGDYGHRTVSFRSVKTIKVRISVNPTDINSWIA
jgi:hypothetical protein